MSPMECSSTKSSWAPQLISECWTGGGCVCVCLGPPSARQVPSALLFSHRSGLKPGDVITEINGRASRRAEDIYEAVRTQSRLTLQVHRGYEVLLLTITPEVTE